MKQRAERGARVKRLRGAVGARAVVLAGSMAGALLALPAWAQPVASSPAPVAAPAASPAAPPASRSGAPTDAARPAMAPAATAVRPTSEVRVIEDDQVRIEETRLRGQLQRVVVAPKSASGSGMRPYEINVGAGGRDPSQDKSGAGQRVWSVFRF